MKTLYLLFLILTVPISAAADVVKFAVKPVDMFVGETKIFSEANVKRVAIGAGDLVTVKEMDGDRLMIIGLQPGSTTVHIWYKNADWAPRAYNIRIAESDPQTRIRSEQMIRFNVRLVEFRKSALSELGIDWSKNIRGPTAAVAGTLISSNVIRPEEFAGLPNGLDNIQGTLGLATTVTSRINFLAANGDASTIAAPTLISLNGGEADFHVGGEVPLPSVDGDGNTSVTFKPFGIRLSVKPRVNEAGVVDTVIFTEVSEIDNSVSVQNIPGFATRNTTTRVQVKSGETIILAGLLSESISKDKASIPGLGKIPGVGRAFSNDLARRQTTELVIFLQPEVVSAEDSTVSSSEGSLLGTDEEQLERWRNKVNINLVN